jgi:hypothetical protein
MGDGVGWVVGSQGPVFWGSGACLISISKVQHGRHLSGVEQEAQGGVCLRGACAQCSSHVCRALGGVMVATFTVHLSSRDYQFRGTTSFVGVFAALGPCTVR